MAKNSLNEKQQRFVEAYLDSMNGTQAVLAAGYNMKDGAAAAHASRMLKTAKIQNALREAREARQSKLSVTASWVLEQIAMIAQDQELSARDRLKALEMLAKHHGLLEKQQDQDENVVRVVIEGEAEVWSE